MKRLSDGFDEECAEGADPDGPEGHEFFVPTRARWSEIQAVTTNIGEALNTACALLEYQNPPLDGVLSLIDFNSESNGDEVLARLVQYLGRLPGP